MKNIFITGANGFIGRSLCKRMLTDGYQVRVAVRRAEEGDGRRVGKGRTED